MALMIGWYKGRDCGPRSGPENSAKAPRGISEGPVGGETRSVSAVRHKFLYSRDCGPRKRTPSPQGAGNVRGKKRAEQGIAAKAAPVVKRRPRRRRNAKRFCRET